MTDYLEAALQQLLQERAELDAAISALQKRIGKPAASSEAPAQQTVRMPIGAPHSGEPIVYRGEFFNLSITKAAEKLLKRAGRPLKTPEILACLQRAGFEIKAKLPRPTIYTSLNRSKDFVKVLPDTWDLSERHPEAAAKKEQEKAQQKSSKSKRKRKAEKDATPGLKTVA